MIPLLNPWLTPTSPRPSALRLRGPWAVSGTGQPALTSRCTVGFGGRDGPVPAARATADQPTAIDRVTLAPLVT